MVYNTSILEKGLKAQFEQAYQQLMTKPHLAQVTELYTEVPSDSEGETYAWLGDLPTVKEWIGDKTIGSLKDYDYAIKNKDFYTGFAIDRNEIEDEKIRAIGPRVTAMAESVARWPWRMITDLIKNGTTGRAYDGSAFFADRASPNDNLLGGTGITLAQVKTDIQTARAAMMRFTSDNGEALGIMMDTIVCPPELEATMLEAVRSASLVTNGSGTLFNPVSSWIKNVIVLPELSDNNDWYGLSTGYSLKPFIFQSRKGVQNVLDDTEVKRNRKLSYSAEMRGNAGYGFFQMAVKVVNG
jgi:phage major head subunit gpT-like protein